jgi:hypothetical protein
MKGLETVMGLSLLYSESPYHGFYAGYAARVGQYADDDCVLVQLLYSCGAVPFVRTNVPQTLMVSRNSGRIFVFLTILVSGAKHSIMFLEGLFIRSTACSLREAPLVVKARCWL